MRLGLQVKLWAVITAQQSLLYCVHNNTSIGRPLAINACMCNVHMSVVLYYKAVIQKRLTIVHEHDFRGIYTLCSSIIRRNFFSESDFANPFSRSAWSVVRCLLSVCLSVVCHIRASCLNHATWQIGLNLRGSVTHCAKRESITPEENGGFGVWETNISYRTLSPDVPPAFLHTRTFPPLCMTSAFVAFFPESDVLHVMQLGAARLRYRRGGGRQATEAASDLLQRLTTTTAPLFRALRCDRCRRCSRCPPGTCRSPRWTVTTGRGVMCSTHRLFLQAVMSDNYKPHVVFGL